MSAAAHDVCLTTGRIQVVFEEELFRLGALIHDRFDDGERLFLRAVLPAEEEVQPRDAVKAGVALRFDQGRIAIHPYLLRQVCTNGAVRAHAVQTRRIVLSEQATEEQAEEELRAALRDCAAPEAFREGVDEMRSAVDSEADTLLNILPLVRRLAALQGMDSGAVAAILGDFLGGDDPSLFALANAITAAARETTDPDLRWRLEEMGGGVPVGADPDPEGRPVSAARAFPESEWADSAERQPPSLLVPA
jgi:hypothetical protein